MCHTKAGPVTEFSPIFEKTDLVDVLDAGRGGVRGYDSSVFMSALGVMQRDGDG